MYYNPMGGAFYLNNIERTLIWQDCRMQGVLPDTFQKSACIILKKMRLGPDHFSKYLQLTAKECENLFLKKHDQPISLAQVMIFCIIIKVPMDIALLLIEKAGYNLNENLELHNCFRDLLKNKEQINGSITAANLILSSRHLPTLL